MSAAEAGFRTVREVVRYLAAQGYEAPESTVYDHKDSRLLRKTKGVFPNLPTSTGTEMRHQPDARITVKIPATGEVLRLDLYRCPTGARRVQIHRDRRVSRRASHGTVSGVFAVLRGWTAGRLWQ